MATVSEAVKKRLTKYITSTKNKIVDAKKRDLASSDIQVLFEEIICKIFGYDKQSDLINVPIVGNLCFYFGVQIKEEIKYILEFNSPKMKIRNENLYPVVEYCNRHHIEWIVRTNGIEWVIHKSNCERPNIYEIVCSFNFLEINIENNDDLSLLFRLCKEFHDKTIITDQYNRYRWWGFLSEDKRTIDFMFLVNVCLYEDVSEKVHIPYLDVTYWCDEKFVARRNADKAIGEYLKNEYGKIYDIELKFETVAYHNEKNHIKTNQSVWW